MQQKGVGYFAVAQTFKFFQPKMMETYQTEHVF
jgi:hypothetical protein